MPSSCHLWLCLFVRPHSSTASWLQTCLIRESHKGNYNHPYSHFYACLPQALGKVCNDETVGKPSSKRMIFKWRWSHTHSCASTEPNNSGFPRTNFGETDLVGYWAFWEVWTLITSPERKNSHYSILRNDQRITKCYHPKFMCVFMVRRQALQNEPFPH